MVLKKILKWLYIRSIKRKLNSLGERVMIHYPIRIEHGEFISIGDGASIYNNSMFQAVQIENNPPPSILIGRNIRIWSNVQISATQKMTIGNDVVLSANSFITDSAHPYEDISHAPRYNKLKLLSEVEIGDDTWIGRNAIVSGCKIGKHCVIGANAFVTKDVPDYCVVVGCPARIVKRFNSNTAQWEKTDKDGNFIV